MSLFDPGMIALFVGLIFFTCGVIFFWQEARGIFYLWRSLHAKQFEERAGRSLLETQAIAVVLETCSHQRKKIFSCKEEFLPDTLHLVSQIAAIYYPDEKAPIQKARIGNILSAFLEVNRKILDMLEIPGLERLTQFRLREVFAREATNKESSSWMPDFLIRSIRLRVMRVLWVQWLLFVGEAAIKVYGEHRADEIIEPETLLDEMDPLQDEADLSLPGEVREIVERSKKKILFAVKPLPWVEVKSIYIALAQNIAQVWHPESSMPLYEVRVYDLLNSNCLEWAGKLSEKPVLNKMLGLRLSHLTGARDMTLPDNKLSDWLKKYQVGRAAKWSKTIFKTLQKKQPAILLRDVALGLALEGGKRGLVLYLHGKIAEETNNLYKSPMNTDGQG